MESESVFILFEFYNNIDILFVIILRLLGFFLILPVFSGINIPNTVKLGFSVVLAYLIFVSGKVDVIVYDNSPAGYIMLGTVEFMTGMLLGFAVFLIFSTVYFAGQMIDYQIGLSMLSVFDPLSQIQVPIIGNFYYFVLSVILIVSGGLNSFVSAIFYSYDVLQPGSAVILGNGNIMWYIVELLTDFFDLGVKISMPLVGSIIIIDICLGILVKTVPQMNVFVVGMPIKLLVGLLLLYTLAPTISIIYDYLYDLSINSLIDIVKGLAP